MKKLIWFIVMVLGVGCVLYNLPGSYDAETAELESYRREFAVLNKGQTEGLGMQGGNPVRTMRGRDAGERLNHLVTNIDSRGAGVDSEMSRRTELQKELAASEQWDAKAYRILLYGKRSVQNLINLVIQVKNKDASSTKQLLGSESEPRERLGRYPERDRYRQLVRNAANIKREGNALLQKKKEIETQIPILISRKKMLETKIGLGPRKLGKTSFAKVQEELALCVNSTETLEVRLGTLVSELDMLKTEYERAKKGVSAQQAVIEKLGAH